MLTLLIWAFFLFSEHLKDNNQPSDLAEEEPNYSSGGSDRNSSEFPELSFDHKAPGKFQNLILAISDNIL